MMDEHEEIDLSLLRKHFEDAQFSVFEFKKNYILVVRDAFPVASIVRATSCFVEFNAFVLAQPSRKFIQGRGRVLNLLNQMNQVTQVSKVTCDEDSYDKEKRAWRIDAQARFATGQIESEYPSLVLERWAKLWLQDIAKLVLKSVDYKITPKFHNASL